MRRTAQPTLSFARREALLSFYRECFAGKVIALSCLLMMLMMVSIVH